MLHAVSHSLSASPAAPGRLLFAKSASSAPPVRPQSAVAIVGSRRSRCGGEAAAFAFASHATQAGFAVISGLALGCDSAAHRGCLEQNGTTIAVLPCGLDRVAPASNTNLANRIVAANGWLASEYLPGVPPAKFRFVERNRVTAALSRAVIVMEAETTSGTMHTARFALQQNKALACYIPSGTEASPGCLHLVRRCGATPLRNPDELKLFLTTLSCESRQSPESHGRGGGGGWRA